MQQRDLTVGNIRDHLIKMAIPAMAAMLTQHLYSLADMYWIGKLHKEAVAAITVVSSVFYLFYFFNNIVGDGSVTIISQAAGSKDMDRTRHSIGTTFSLKILLGVIAMVAMVLFMEPALGLFTKDEQIISAGAKYGYWMAAFTPIFFTSYTTKTALRSLGDARTPLRLTVFSSVLNIILDPIMMFETLPVFNIPGLGWGISGVAAATCIATTAEMILGISILFKRNNPIGLRLRDMFIFDISIVKRTMAIGFPSALAQTVTTLALTVNLSLVGEYGTAAIAAWGVVMPIFQFVSMPLHSLSSAAVSVAGQSFGHNDIVRVEETRHEVMKLTVSLSLVVVIIAIIIAPQAITFFINDAEVIAIGTVFMRIIILIVFIEAFIVGEMSIFSAAGHTMPILISSLVSLWVIQLPLAYISVRLLKLPPWGIAVCFSLGLVAQAVMLYIEYRSGKWKKKITLKGSMAEVEV